MYGFDHPLKYVFKYLIALKSTQMRRYRIKGKEKRVLVALRDSR